MGASSLGNSGDTASPGKERACACERSSGEAEAGRCFLSAVCSRSQSIKKGGALQTQGLQSSTRLREMHRAGFGFAHITAMRIEANGG